jgi:hypothetical protein
MICTDANCIDCYWNNINNTELCTNCVTGYIPSNNNISCIVRVCTDNNCLACPSSVTVCTLCPIGYALKNYANLTIGC